MLEKDCLSFQTSDMIRKEKVWMKDPQFDAMKWNVLNVNRLMQISSWKALSFTACSFSHRTQQSTLHETQCSSELEKERKDLN